VARVRATSSDRLDAAGTTPARADMGGTRLGYHPGLDGLRALAILFVLLQHTGDFLAPGWRGWFFTGGFLGVDIFLVLSGFLITTLLLERHRREASPLRYFWTRRMLRLLPAVVALLCVNLVITILERDEIKPALTSFPVVLSYLTNWAMLHSITISPSLTHLWSLAVEEQFYVVWPLLLFGALWAGFSRRLLAWLTLAAVVATVAWRAYRFQHVPGLALYIRTDMRADALLIGALLAFARLDLVIARVPRALRSLLGCAAIAFLTFAALAFTPLSPWLYYGGFTLVALVAALLLVIELHGDWTLHRVLRSRPLIAIGILSYSLYLWHFLAFRLIARHFPNVPVAVRIGLGLFWAAVAAIASYAFVERPALRVKDRIGRKRVTRPGAVRSTTTPTSAVPTTEVSP
jgi:peptidoglycan/LPS O-acetylase OafA/YrhL